MRLPPALRPSTLYRYDEHATGAPPPSGPSLGGAAALALATVAAFVLLTLLAMSPFLALSGLFAGGVGVGAAVTEARA